MPQGGKLTLEAANVYLGEEYCRANPELTPGQFVCISVTDTGTGMAPDVLARAFESAGNAKTALAILDRQ
jgi:CheY-like chemotaxis protein